MHLRNIVVAAALIYGSLTCASMAQAQSLIHDYELNGSYADALGGPALVDAGGTLTATNYVFDANQGLSLSNGLSSGSASSGNYSIETVFRFSTVGGYRKIIDFKDRTSDTGVYNLNTDLNFYNPAFGPNGAFAANTDADVVITRDGSTNLVFGYVNGVQQFGFPDNGSLGVFSGANNIIQFFKDDFVTGQGEASGGVVDRIRIYDGALSAAQVAALNTTPEPGSVATLIGMGVTGVGFLVRRKRVRK